MMAGILVMTDLLMPEPEGRETIQQLRTITPPPKIIAILGGRYIGRLDCLEAALVLGADRT
jgi:CheY-like chemotaxis protein